MIVLTDNEKDYITRKKSALKNNDLKAFYGNGTVKAGRITQFLLERGIDVFDYFDALPQNMFAGADIQSISIPGHIKKIGKYCFYDCPNLEVVDLGNVEVIDEKAFCDCPNLKKVFFPDSLRILGPKVFEGCDENIVLLANSRKGASRLRCKQADIPWYKEHLMLNSEGDE